MGCKCKQKLEKLDELENGITIDDEKPNLLLRIIQFIFQIIFGVIVSGLIVILLVPLLLYMFICLMLGKDISISISRIITFFSRKPNK